MLNRAVQVLTGLLMNGDIFGFLCDEIAQITVRVFNHQMNVVGGRFQAVQGLHNGSAETDIRYEVAVHDIHMDEIGACFCYIFHLLSQSCEIR